ncbi:hypothetical protein Pfo_015236 [Paulownia fortunei]|nr:hypothetical protein Pfo_015236 [Paulownia fortunei]
MMAPRRQKRKSRLSRMDAAIDAMLPYGFAENHVRKVTRQLLKEYGGDEGWPFIEEFSYKELIEAILREVEACDQMTTVEHGNPSQTDSKDESLAEDSGIAAEDIVLIGPELPCVADPTCSEVDRNKRGLGLDQTSREKEREITDAARDNVGEIRAAAHPSHTSTPDSASLSPSLPPVNRLRTRRRLPCYGWIESDEEDVNDFMYLAPAVESNPTPSSGAFQKFD